MNTPSTITLGLSLALAPLVHAGGGGTASIQIIHNCADLAASSVDVWVNGALLLDDFAFRTATPFVSVPAGIPLNVGIAPPNSDNASDAIYEQTFTLNAGGTYIVVASGIVSASGYMPMQPFTLAAYDMAEQAGTAGNTDVLVYHGCTDAPTVDVYESSVLHATAVDNIAYGSFAGYLSLPTADYALQVRNAANSAIVAAYGAPLATLGLDGAAITVLASGFLDPSMNSNGPAFGLYAATAAGGPLVPLPALTIPSARVQVIHNCADLAAATVDVWLNDAPLLNDFAFRTASPFVDAQAGVPFVVSICPPNSTDTTSALAQYTYTLDEGGTYILVANGIVSASGYSPVRPFDLYVSGDAREQASMAGQTDVLVFHGSTDAPTVDVAETAVLGGATLVDDLTYGSFAGYLEVPTDDYVLEVRTSDGTPVVAYNAPLATLGLQGAAITVLASGFLDPTMNSNGPAFGLWVALASGGDLVPLSVATGVSDLSALGSGIRVYPNPATVNTTLEMTEQEVTRVDLQVVDMSGRTVLRPGVQELASGPNRLPLDVSALAPGSYRLLLRTEAGTGSLPLVVVR